MTFAIPESCESLVVPTKKGKKRDAVAAAAKKSALADFTIEYSKSGRATCRGCEQKIAKDEVKTNYFDFMFLHY